MNRVFPTVILVLCSFLCGSTTAETPPYSETVGWSPHYQHFSELGHSAERVINYVKEITSYTSNSIELRDSTCRGEFLFYFLHDKGVGVFVLDSHGCASGVRLETYATTDYQTAAARRDEYNQLYPPFAGKFYLIEWTSVTPSFWAIVVDATVTASWIQSGGKSSPGLFFDIACGDGAAAPTFLNSRATFAYAVTASNYIYDIDQILGRMLGTLDNGAHRDAYSAYQNTPNPQISFYGSTVELCPVVVGTSPYYLADRHFRRVGGGYVSFSEEMADDTLSLVNPGSGVSWQEHGVPRWHDATHKRVDFDYCISGGEGTYTVVISGSAKAKSLDMAKPFFLDGNKVAPNCDDYVISFKVKDCGP